MNIEKIDKNFASKNVTVVGDKASYAIPHENFSLFGIYYDEENHCFTRMPIHVADSVSEGVAALSTNTAGGRLCFTTNSSFIQLQATYNWFCNMRHMPLTGSSGFSLFELMGDKEVFVGVLAPQAGANTGFSDGLSLKGGTLRKYVLYFPLYNNVQTLTLTLDKDATVEKLQPYKDVLPILYYGSSITQGGCASRPDNTYQALICKRNHVDFINLGFAGNARAETHMVDYLAQIDCSLFVCDYDHNAPTVEYLQNTVYPLYERYRRVRKTTPILFITKPDFKVFSGDEMRHNVVKDAYEKAKALGDNNVYFLSGKEFFKDGNVCDYTVDNCHPTDYGFAEIAKKIYRKMQEIDKVFQGENDD